MEHGQAWLVDMLTRLVDSPHNIEGAKLNDLDDRNGRIHHVLTRLELACDQIGELDRGEIGRRYGSDRWKRYISQAVDRDLDRNPLPQLPISRIPFGHVDAKSVHGTECIGDRACYGVRR